VTLGEALYQLRRDDPDVYSGIPEANRIVAFRHVLVHGYALVDDDVVWDAVQAKLPVLLARIETLLADSA
jgi:uncharacterized protein with HEPN domain